MEEILDSHRKAIEYAKKAVSEFNNYPPSNWEKWPIWDSPKTWSIRLIPNFEATQHSMEKALVDARSGNFKRMRYLTESIRGISKDMDRIGWKWWSHIDLSISESFDYNFKITKNHAENI